MADAYSTFTINSGHYTLSKDSPKPLAWQELIPTTEEQHNSTTGGNPTLLRSFELSGNVIMNITKKHLQEVLATDSIPSSLDLNSSQVKEIIGNVNITENDINRYHKSPEEP